MGVAPGEGGAPPREGEPPRPAPPGEPPRPAPPGEPPRVHGELSNRAIWTLGAVIGGLYAIGAIARGAVLPGIVGGVLATVLCFLVLREVRQRRRRLDRARRGGG